MSFDSLGSHRENSALQSSRESGAISEARIIAAIHSALLANEPIAVATVIATDRSVPRRPGAKMIVRADGSTLGSIGGGEMESRCIQEALRALSDGAPRRLSYELVDVQSGDPGVCGGTVELYVEAYMPSPTVLVVGCGHVGRAVIDLANWLGFRVVATDDRTELADPTQLPNAHLVIPGSIQEAIDSSSIGAHTSIVLVTRNVKIDLEILPPLLATSAGYIGLMGSKRRWETTREALLERGLDASSVDRIQTPIGLEINAESPQEIAVSIMAEVIAHRRGAAPA